MKSYKEGNYVFIFNTNIKNIYKIYFEHFNNDETITTKPHIVEEIKKGINPTELLEDEFKPWNGIFKINSDNYYWIEDCEKFSNELKEEIELKYKTLSEYDTYINAEQDILNKHAQHIINHHSSFEKFGINIGTTLTFIGHYKHPDKTEVVTNDNKNEVVYKGEAWNISALAKLWTEQTNTNGFAYFCIEGDKEDMYHKFKK